MAESIQKYGLLNPILVRPPEEDGTLTTLAGQSVQVTRAPRRAKY